VRGAQVEDPLLDGRRDPVGVVVQERRQRMDVDGPPPPPDDGGDVRGDGPAGDDGAPGRFRNATFLSSRFRNVAFLNFRRGRPAGR
jgi:hypothetical protein